MFIKNTRMLNIFSLLIVLLLSYSTFSFGASTTRRGTAGAQELLIPVGARNIAMSGSFVAGINGIEAAAWNPAGVSGMEGNVDVIFSQTSWLAGIGVNYAAFASNFGGNNFYGMTLRSLDFGEIPVTTTSNPDGTGETFSPNFVTIGFLFSRKMTDRIFFGADFKIVNESIMRESATGFVLDAGVQYLIKENGLRLGVSLKNLGLNMIFDGPDLEEYHIPDDSAPGTPSEPRRVHLQEFEMPTTLEMGASYGPLNSGVGQINLAASFLNNNFSFDEYRFGGEFSFQDILFIRVGTTIGYNPEPFGQDGIEGTEDDTEYYVKQTEEFIWGPTYGFGVNLEKVTALNLTFDYAYRPAKFFEPSDWITLRLSF